MTRSTFSTTTIASSTTMPIARTIASSETVLAEYPTALSAMNVPIRLTGTASVGIKVARTLQRNRETRARREQGLKQHLLHFVHDISSRRIVGS